mgnify:CR=1 FL=1
MSPSRDSRIGRLSCWLLLAVLAGEAGLYLHGMGRGFDFTDEGAYYLSFAHPENVPDKHTSYFIFGSKLFTLLGHNLVAMRLAALFANLGSTLIFWFGLDRFVAQFAPSLLPPEMRRLAGGATLAASFLGYAISPPALSYNFQNAACLLTATGCLLYTCAAPLEEKFFRSATVVSLVLFGALAGLDFFIKFSTSVPLAVGGLGFFLAVSRKSWRQKSAVMLLPLGCAAVAGALYFLFFEHWSEWREGTFGTLDAILHQGFAGREILRYRTEIAVLFESVGANFLLSWFGAGLFAGLVLGMRRWPRVQSVAALLGGATSLGLLLAQIGSLGDFTHPRLQSVLALLLLALLLAVVSRLARPAPSEPRPWSWRMLLLGGWLAFLPYLGAFGTSNNINSNTLYQLSPWFAFAGLLLVQVDLTWSTVWAGRIGLWMLTLVAAAWFYRGYWIEPYRLVGGRPPQVVATLIGTPATSLRLDPATHEFIAQSRRILVEHGFKPGDDLLVFFDLPGFAFAMGGASPGHPWYFAGDASSQALDRMRLETVELARRKRAFLVRNSVDSYWNDFLPELRAAGLNFPGDYRLISPPMLSPFTRVPFEIWMPVARSPSP